MSRIGKKTIVIPAGVTVTLNGSTATVKGPKGELVKEFNPEITINIEATKLTFLARLIIKTTVHFMVQLVLFLITWLSEFPRVMKRN